MRLSAASLLSLLPLGAAADILTEPAPDEEVKLLVRYTNSFGKFSTSSISTRSINPFDSNDNLIDRIASSARTVSIKGQISQVKVSGGEVDSAIEALLADEEVAEVELDYPMYKFPRDGDPSREQDHTNVRNRINDTHSRSLDDTVPYGIKLVQAPALWSSTRNPVPIKVCIVDTGYDLGHIDLPKDGVTSSPTDFENAFHDGDGHGTHVAGIIGALGNDGGVVGVNPTSNTISFHIAKALGDDGRGSASTVIEGVEGCLDAGAKIITLSLGGGKRSSIQEKLFREAYDNGVLVFAASGNSGTSVSEYPASYPYVISVAAVDQDEKYASFSNFNDQVELVGPGVSIKSTLPGDKYGILSGTSMAAPHVAGAAALVWSFFPECSNNQIRNVLAVTAKDVNPSTSASGCNSKTGFGLIQAKAAFDMLEQFGCDTAGGKDNTPLSEGVDGGCFKLPEKPKTNRPTRRPTKVPSRPPTSKPTKRPTQKPTRIPTVQPSHAPSVSPTKSPSASPSFRVFKEALPFVSSPTLPPSILSHDNSTEFPSNSPSNLTFQLSTTPPTSHPSRSPNQPPSSTKSPSLSPSKSPSVSPSKSPSLPPSASPSTSPSVSPTASPSTSPSVSPSKSPSVSPSMSPSTPPSASPSTSPSGSPSASPSTSPSGSPSRSPTGSPSMSPSRTPSISPTASPSVSPSASPSKSPYSSPSQSPTESPSNPPSPSPTNSPISSPTLKPSRPPTKSPSVVFRSTISNKCPTGEVPLDIEFTLNSNPSDVYWFLINKCSRNIVFDCQDCFKDSDPSSSQTFGGCIPNARYEFYFSDYSGMEWAQGGYVISYNGTQVFDNRGNMTTSKELSFGNEDDCPDSASLLAPQALAPTSLAPTSAPSSRPSLHHCPNGQVWLDIQFALDADPSKVYWFLLDKCSRNIVFSCQDCFKDSDPYSSRSFGGCIPESEYEFYFSDYSGDDWTQGGYVISYNGTQVFDGKGNVTPSKRLLFGSENECQDSVSVTGRPTFSPTSSAPTLAPSSRMGLNKCPTGEVRLDIQFALDADASKVYWFLLNKCTRNIVMDCQDCFRGSEPYSSKSFGGCFPDSGYEFYFSDYSGNDWTQGGYVITYDGAEVFDSRGQVTPSKDLNFGGKCQDSASVTARPSRAPTSTPPSAPQVTGGVMYSTACSSEEGRFDVQFVLDVDPSTVYWYLIDRCTRSLIFDCQGCYANAKAFSSKYFVRCLPEGHYSFIFNDYSGTEWTKGGYVVTYNGTRVFDSKGNFQHSQEVPFGNSNACPQPNLKPSLSPESLQPETTPTATSTRGNYCEMFDLDIATDSTPSDISWNLQQLSGNNVGLVAYGPVEGQPYESNSLYVGAASECLPPGEYEFTIRATAEGIDSPGYYKIFLNEVEIRQGNKFDSVQTTGFVISDRERIFG
ncbi:hypothetical protein HJC23_000997 [Cyclotella cryptica]|uniref:subtilisin n=1 Tax=Cyclotella cryptica TaxID=29204 RepID=A0ABD3NZP9_9STRA